MALGALIVILMLPAAAQAPVTGRVARVTDGDTFRLETGERVRIAGIDAPETQQGQARCRAEVVRGGQAKARARALLQGRIVAVRRVGRSYGRTVAEVRLDGRDVADLLVAVGAARPWPRGKAKPDWCRSSRLS